MGVAFMGLEGAMDRCQGDVRRLSKGTRGG